MAKKKKTPAGNRQAKQRTFASQLLRVAAGAIFLMAVAAGIILVALILLPKNNTPVRPLHPIADKTPRRPVFEIYPEEAPSRPVARKPCKSVQTGVKPSVAIIIDDVGYDRRIARRFLDIGIPVTLSVLPHSPFSKSIAQTAHEKNMEIMLHLPMEPLEYPKVNPGPGVLLTAMSPDELIRQLEAAIADVPHVKGVNNHMGSKMTAISTQMYQIFTVLKKHDLFFIDSRTSSGTLCKPSARLLRVPFSERDVFLDNSLSSDYIDHQLDILVDIACQKGSAIGIGHPHSATLRVIKQNLGWMQQKVTFVPASHLVEQIGL
ncbi:MAG: divergent polysaccharide deacetylase family protein [Thermodesulfobacteriota bacterium]|nr:divergent polysaccharide deacetylase family protein [Thermodesulfobacteriota bacterium]